MKAVGPSYADRPVVLITGGNFRNQGAFLMLRAAEAAIKDRFGAHAALGWRWGSERDRRRAGLDTLIGGSPYTHFRPSRAVPEPIRQRLPYLTPGQVDAVVDVSGFAFGDQWAHARLAHRARVLARWGRSRPLVLLPQAFGPFRLTAAPVRTAVSAANLVYARDVVSEAELREALAPRDRQVLRRAPDFTCLLPGTPVASVVDTKLGVPIVPNWNIFSREGNARGADYVRTLIEAARFLMSMGLQPYGLGHEGERDEYILRLVQSEVPDLELAFGLDGLESKHLLGQAPVAVSGRYHADVSALSQGVPTVMHGWSHKYDALADDYGVKDLLVNPYDPAATVAALATHLNSPPERRHLLDKVSLVKREVEQMWLEVGNVLQLKS